jgi:hypothetical protein
MRQYAIGQKKAAWRREQRFQFAFFFYVPPLRTGPAGRQKSYGNWDRQTNQHHQ